MRKRWIVICLAAVMLWGCIAVVVPGAVAAENEASLHSMLEKLPLENIPYEYENDGTDERSAVYFSNALLLQDARVFSGELTKASVALAMAAYSSEYVNGLLSQMGFTTDDNSAEYDRVAKKLTLDDNDYVAYTIAHKSVTHPITGETYMIYCVPIKGTGANAEWFSNFNIGTEKEHAGFRNASMKVYNALQSCFEAEEDNIDADHRIVWITGHSRGAACANLIAGWLSSSGETYTKPEHVFGYTFACPAVSLNADTGLTNIYNFNNPGDLVPMLPLKEWEYKRYGQTITLDTSSIQLTNVKQQFERITSETYAGEVSDQHYRTLLTNIFGTDLDAFNDSAYMKLTLGLAGWALGGMRSARIDEVILKYLDGADFIVETLRMHGNLFSLKTYLNILLGSNDEYSELCDWAYQAYLDTQDMTAEEFQSFLARNAQIISEIEEKTQIGISVPGSFLDAYNILRVCSLNLTSVIQCFEAAIALIADEDGNVSKKMTDAHTQSTYTVWINSLYYGCMGWYETDSLQHAEFNSDHLSIGSYCFAHSTTLQEVTIPDNVILIGKWAFNWCEALTDLVIPGNIIWISNGAFASCSGMKALTLPDTPVALGAGAFSNCSGLRTVTLPVDYDYSQNPFESTTGVTAIHYTYGTDGVMTDRTLDGYGPPDYENTLEYASRDRIQTITFEEGITHIGNALFNDGSKSLTNVEFPSTLQTIGDYAFHSCSALVLTSGFPDSLTTIGDDAFYGCHALTELVISENITSIGDYAFGWCEGLEELTLPNTPVALGSCAFGVGEGLTTITLPVDYDYSKGPFYNCSGDYTANVTIHYTFGTSGIMADRTTNEGATFYYKNALECSLNGRIQTITFEEGITNIGNNFIRNGNFSLTNVEFPSTLQTIGDYAFAYCDALALPSGFPDSLTTIGDYAFYSCDALTELVIPGNVTSIGDYAFSGCFGIKEIMLPDTPVALGAGAFGGCIGLTTVTLPVDYDFSQDPFDIYYTDATSIVTAIHYTCGRNGVMADRTIDGEDPAYYEKTLEYESRNSIQTVTFEEGITHIGNNLFYDGSESLTNVEFPSTLKSIGDYAFRNCEALANLTFTADAPQIDSNAFYGVTATAYYPIGNETWTTDVMQDYGGNITWFGQYEILEGDNAVVDLGENGELMIRVAGEKEKVERVTVDGETVDPANYAVTGDSAIVTFTTAFLKTLEDGDHVVVIHFSNGVAIADITIEKPAYILGDVTEDGKVDIKDYSRILSHVKKLNVFTDPQILSCADVTGDGKVDIKDYSRVLAHCKKLNPLF